MSESVTWLEPRYPVDEFGPERVLEMAAALEKQLHREICAAHVLRGHVGLARTPRDVAARKAAIS